MIRPGHITFPKLEEISYGAPAAEALAAIVESSGAERLFLMVSGTLDRETDEIARIEAALGSSVSGKFAAMPAHSPRSAVIEAANAARGAEADLIVTLGGGSITDAAKAVQLCLSNNITSIEGMDRLVSNPDDAAPPIVRQISIPTTLSGGEFSAIAGITNEATAKKEMLRHPLIIPQAVILDPAVTLHTPEWLWLSTGIRAVDHCVEGICSGEANAYGDAQALKGLALLASGLPRVKADPSDLAARLDCQMGTWLSMGPLSSGVPMGASHGVGYILGAAHGVPHGYTSCIMLPAVMRWNLSSNAERQRMAAAAMGNAGIEAADLLDQLISGLGMPRTLREVGINRDDLDTIAEGAMATPWVPRNPRPITDPAQVREILDIAF